MANNTVLNPGALGDVIATLDVAGVKHEKVLVEYLDGGVPTLVEPGVPFPVTDAAAEALLTSLAAEDFATQATLAAVLAKIIAAPATEAKQDTGNTSLSSIDGKFTTLNAKDFATQTTLAAILAKIIAAPATEAKQDTMITSLAAIDAGTAAALGQAAMAASVPVVIASNQSAIPVSGTVTVDTSLLAKEAKQDTQITAEQAIQAAVQIMDDWDESDRAKVNLIVGQAGIAAGTGVDGVTVPRVTLATNVALPAGTNAIGKLAANSGVDIGDVDVTTLPAITIAAAQTLANVTTLGTITNTVPVQETRVSTSTLSNVASSASSVTILASNANRRQAMFYNDSTAILYLKFGATASTSSFTVPLVAGAYYELPQPIYTGIIDGIWSAANGNARVTELT